ncbi:MAG: TlpA disulfide reductase family protein [Planctomycetota bacterium]|nr:TlpA disulfide reductase family protein [Planctomycetota bacterium]
MKLSHARHSRALCAACVLSLVVTATANHSIADDPSTFAKLIEQQLKQVSDYIRKHPDAADIDDAYTSLFQTAEKHGLHEIALPHVEDYAKRANADPNVAKLAQRVQLFGLARSGKTTEAVNVFGELIRSVSIRMPDETLDIAKSLASDLQVAGDHQAAKQTYDRVSTAFFLNTFVRRLCDGRMAKLQLVNQAAPAIRSTSTNDKTIDLAELKGKVVLVDFWATNCPPCLKEFPRLKQLYADYHDRGFEVIGISLDEEREIVDRFQAKWELPWPLVVSIQGRGPIRTRYRVETIPSMFLVDKTGKIVAADLTNDSLRRAVAKLVAE